MAAPDILVVKGGYQQGELLVLPVEGPDADLLLAKAYLRFKEEESLAVIFYERVYSLTEFLNWALGRDMKILAAFRQFGPEESDYEFCGLSWINRPISMGGEFHKTEIGMGFFRRRRAKGAHQNLAFGRLMLRWLFDHLDLDVIFGTTPVQNKLALRFAEQIGFSMHGPIPNYTTWQGQMTDVYVSSLSKQDWLERGR